MKPYPIDKYKSEIQALAKVENYDLRIYLRNVARLASMGDPSILNEWQKEVDEKSKNDIAQHLEERSSIGIWQLDNFDGIDLAHSIIETYDMSCLIHLDKESENPIFKTIYASTESWIDNAEDAFGSLNDEAADFLNNFLIKFPINESHRLKRVPLGDTERTFIRSFSNLKTPLCLQILKSEQQEREAAAAAADLTLYQVAEFPAFALPLAADDGSAPVEIINAFKKFNAIENVDLGDDEICSIWSRIEPNWELVVNFEKPKGWADQISRIILGPIVLQCKYRDADSEVWGTSFLESIPRSKRSEIMHTNINKSNNRVCITLFSGRRYYL